MFQFQSLFLILPILTLNRMRTFLFSMLVLWAICMNQIQAAPVNNGTGEFISLVPEGSGDGTPCGYRWFGKQCVCVFLFYFVLFYFIVQISHVLFFLLLFGRIKFGFIFEPYLFSKCEKKAKQQQHRMMTIFRDTVFGMQILEEMVL